jgi:hypothetical protein
MSPLAVAIVIGLVAAGWSTPTRAQSANDKAKAEALFNEGMRLFNRGKFASACAKLEASVDLFSGIGNRGKLAECYERDGRTASAWRLYQDVEQQARRMNDDARATVAAQRALALESRLARLTIAPGPTVEVKGFAIQRNRVEQPPRLFHIAVPVDPGAIRIRASAPGYQSFGITVMIAEGESKTVTIPPLALIPAKDGGLGTGRIVALSLVGVGAVSLLGGSTYVGWSARSRWADVPEACRNGTSPCTAEDIAVGNEANRRANIANIMGAVGVAAVATGVFIWWRSGKGKGARNDRSVQLIPALGPDHVGVLVHTSM